MERIKLLLRLNRFDYRFH